MNEEAQLKAMASELIASGYDVRQDVSGDTLKMGASKLSGPFGITLDLVAELFNPKNGEPDRPRLLIVEVANRRRRNSDASPKGRPLPRYVEDDEAVRRFELISEAVAALDHVALEIRFFDVSADQAAARKLRNPLRSKAAMFNRIDEARGLLARSAGRDELSRALVVTRLWSHWVRIAGNLHPGREHREMKSADLRTIQKDLFDQKIIQLAPGRYCTIHQSVLAAFEGGDLEPQHLLELEPDVRVLLDWAAERLGAPQDEVPTSTSLLGRLRKEVNERAFGPRKDALSSALIVMALAENTENFPRRVMDFLLALGREPIISDDLMTALLERAANPVD